MKKTERPEIEVKVAGHIYKLFVGNYESECGNQVGLHFHFGKEGPDNET